MRGTTEFYALQDFFERTVGKTDGVYLSSGSTPSALKANRAKRDDNGNWPHYFYDNGAVDGLFRLFMSGYSYRKSEENCSVTVSM